MSNNMGVGCRGIPFPSWLGSVGECRITPPPHRSVEEVEVSVPFGCCPPLQSSVRTVTLQPQIGLTQTGSDFGLVYT